MILRDFTCAVCGAPRKTTDQALVVLCRHCGAILTFSGDGLWQPTALAARHAAGIAALVKPSAAAARLMAISLAMARATAPEQRERWRLLAEEQTVAMAIAYPQNGIPLPAEPEARKRHIANAVVMSELVTFDPRISGLMRAYASAAGTITNGDPIAAVRSMLDAARAYYRAIEVHPQMPPGSLREGAEHLAKELVRSGIHGYASLLGDRAIERIRTEVLGDTIGSSLCPKCGGPLESDTTRSLTRCKHCGAVTNVETEDAWTQGQLAIWEISKKDLLRRGQLDGPTPVLTAAGGFLHTNARDVAPEKAFAFLRRAIPWLSRPEMIQGLDILVQAGSPEQRGLLDALRGLVESTWLPDPAQRPAAHVARTNFPAPTPHEEAAWVESALALWNYRREYQLPVLLSHPLNGLHVAAVHEQPAAITPRAALQFFDRAWPGWDHAEMAQTIHRLLPGYDHPRVNAFLRELVARL